jgi:flavin reductase (DIM6/NTAB) family NADH-FMN oxidoreductase RutF
VGDAVLPEWRAGTVAVLSTVGGAPHAIPVSTAVRAGPRRVLLALARTRESLARLRADPRCALTVLAAGDVALTAHGRATVVQEPLAGAEGVTAVAIDVEAIQSHADPRFRVDDGVRWRWTDPEAERRDHAVHAALARLAG